MSQGVVWINTYIDNIPDIVLEDKIQNMKDMDNIKTWSKNHFNLLQSILKIIEIWHKKTVDEIHQFRDKNKKPKPKKDQHHQKTPTKKKIKKKTPKKKNNNNKTPKTQKKK